MFATLLFSEPFCNLAALYKVIRRKVIVCQVRWLSRVTLPGMRGKLLWVILGNTWYYLEILVTLPGMRGKLSYPYHTPSMRGKLLRVSRGKKRVSRAWDATDTRILKWWCSTCSAQQISTFWQQAHGTALKLSVHQNMLVTDFCCI